jgi:hypothetical protein
MQTLTRRTNGEYICQYLKSLMRRLPEVLKEQQKDRGHVDKTPDLNLDGNYM